MSVRIECLTGDLTTQEVDAIVNAASPALRGGGGVDGAIHRASGPGLLAELVERYPTGCATGEAKPTAGYDLPANYVIHTPGPIWNGGASGEPGLLAASYENSLRVAIELGCESLAFPAISCGVYGYPIPEAAKVAMETIVRHAEEPLRLVRLVGFTDELTSVFQTALNQALA